MRPVTESNTPEILYAHRTHTPRLTNADARRPMRCGCQSADEHHSASPTSSRAYSARLAADDLQAAAIARNVTACAFAPVELLHRTV